MRWAIWALSLMACEPTQVVELQPDATVPEAGVDADASVTADASVSPDATVPEAGVNPDASASVNLDASVFDAGATDLGFEDAGFDAGVDAGPPPWARLDQLTLYLNLGDSFGAGYNAGQNRGYAALLCQNHATYPAWSGDSVTARFPQADCRNRAESGAQSPDVVGQTNNLPASAGDTLVTIYVGGNDFNDDIRTIISQVATQAAIQRWTSNLSMVLTRLRNQYHAPAQGRELVVLIATIHDPTDGTGAIPPQFDQGFCGVLQNPLFTPALRQQGLMNLGSFNAAIRAFAAQEGAIIFDSHDIMFGHGMNGADRLLDDDCIHGNNAGHHQVRREAWRVLTGNAPP